MGTLSGHKTYLFTLLAFVGYGLQRLGVGVPDELLVALVAAAVLSLRAGVAKGAVKVLLPLLLVAGCTYPAPLSRRLSPERKAQLMGVERCCRANKAAVWDGYLHSPDT